MSDLSWVTSSAVISSDQLYRYELTREWDRTKPMLEWIMLNPSTADGLQDDPTIRRCIGFAKRWYFGGIIVHNRFAYRATRPSLLTTVDDPFGPENHYYLSQRRGSMCVAAWGASPLIKPDDPQPRAFDGRRLYCLGVAANGQPRHPLYIKATQQLEIWKGRA